MDKRLLIIGSSLNYGSPGHICESIGLKAMANGWTVYQAHGLKYSRPSSLKTYAVCSKLGEFRHTIKSFLFDAHGLSSKKETKRLIAWIESISPDVIHLHNLHGYYLNYQILFEFLSKYGRPIVWTMHDFWPITGHCAHFDYIGCDKWKTECRNCPQSSSYPRSLFIDKSSRNFNAKRNAFTSVNNLTVVTVSDWVKSLYKESFLNKYPIQTIHNGVNTEIFKPTRSKLRSKLGLKDKFVMLGVASPWYPLKGFNDYLSLSNVLPKDCVIIMIGLTRKQIKELPPNIIGIERTDSKQELAQFYSMADVTLNLSYQETFGMTTIEGMACGTPAIVYNRTASPELVTPQTGIVVNAGDIKELLRAIIFIKDKGKNPFTNSCRDTVLTEFNEDNQIRRYVNLYNKVNNAEDSRENI